MNEMLPHRAIILGGASSGKSNYAERLVFRGGEPRHYIATAQAWDAEMRAKIEAHRTARGPDWITHECPLDLAPALSAAREDDVVLLDCATLWLSNHLLAEADLPAMSRMLIDQLSACPARIVVVSNEVGQGIVPDHAMGRQFRDAQGKLNQMLGAWADLAVVVMAGLPLALKGKLP